MEETETTKREECERIAKYLAECGIASRRNCEQYVAEGRVSVNGQVVTSPAYNVKPGVDDVRFEDRKVVPSSQGKVYLMLNKPAGYTCSAYDVHAEKLVYQLIPEQFGRVFTIGRLDRDSEGLLLLTNDGDFAQSLTHPSKRVVKRYYVECEGQFTTSLRRKMLDGLYDNGEFLQALAVEQKSVQRGLCALEVVLGEGRKREVRRLCKDVGLKVLLLRRIAIGKLFLDRNLKVGGWRVMTEEELKLALAPSDIKPAHSRQRPGDTRPYWMVERDEKYAAREKRAGRGGRMARHDISDEDMEENGFSRERPRFKDPMHKPEHTGNGRYDHRRGNEGNGVRIQENGEYDAMKPFSRGGRDFGEHPLRDEKGGYAGGKGWMKRGEETDARARDGHSSRYGRPAYGPGASRSTPKRYDEDEEFDAMPRNRNNNFRRKGPPRNWR